MSGFPRAAPSAETFLRLFGAQPGDPWRWRLMTSASVMSVAWASSLAAAWLAWRPADPMGAVAAGAFALVSAAAATLLGRLLDTSADAPAIRSRPEPDPADPVTGSGDTIDALAVADALRQADKMETIGRCVGEFAHDINNLLTVILCNLDRAAKGAAPGTKTSCYLADATTASDRAARLVGDILAFSRREPALPRLVDVDHVIAAMQPLILSVASGCAVDFELGCGWPCRVEVNQLENAVLNLVVNARDAMPNGGRIVVTTFGAFVGDDDPRKRMGDYVVLAVSDIGVGMPPAVVARAFEPFFTTKAAGRGTGLGLAQIAGFVRRAAGSAWIDSAPGLGTRVSLFLPRCNMPNDDLVSRHQ